MLNRVVVVVESYANSGKFISSKLRN